MKNPKTPARLPRKAPSNQTGGTAWGKKLAAEISRMAQAADMKKLILLNFPYIIAFYMVEKAAWLYRHCNGDSVVDRLMVLFMNFGLAYKSVLPSFHPFDLMVGLVGAAALKAVIYFKGKNAKKYRQGEEYGSARWGNQKDIEPFIDPVFENNVILTQTERLMMSGRPKHPKYARNKNVIVIGGSGSGKTRFYVKPNLMQMPQKVSYVVTDPKGTIIIECGKMLSDAGYKIKVLNTINFKKSMRYNPFHYIRSEKDILKLVNTIIANTKGDGEKSGEDFWIKAERLLYCALIGYIWYEAPEEEQNFSTLLEFINASEAREDDEEFKNAVDDLFEELEEALIMADMGVQTTMDIVENLRKRVKREHATDPAVIKDMLIDEITAILQEGAQEDKNLPSPSVLLVIGVNGVGKTTTIGKLAHNFKEDGKSVLLAAADTFRAAAIDQLEIWGERSEIPVIKHEENSDPAAVVYDAVHEARKQNTDLLICDTAGRLHNKKNLMEELKKIARVIEREYPAAHREVYLVLDATTGQNALQQAKLFQEVTDITGIVLTKLDGTAKGGIVVAIKSELQIPVRYIGVGEGIHDLQKFDAAEFAGALFGREA